MKKFSPDSSEDKNVMYVNNLLTNFYYVRMVSIMTGKQENAPA